mmetsp:Transcript_1539/g.5650  ORF Transcript_1539/g.5650 Transcript_1539/m.5650 type:complete len:205 (-) Transcript_1539:197-811(-)
MAHVRDVHPNLGAPRAVVQEAHGEYVVDIGAARRVDAARAERAAVAAARELVGGNRPRRPLFWELGERAGAEGLVQNAVLREERRELGGDVAERAEDPHDVAVRVARSRVPAVEPHQEALPDKGGRLPRAEPNLWEAPVHRNRERGLALSVAVLAELLLLFEGEAAHALLQRALEDAHHRSGRLGNNRRRNPTGALGRRSRGRI